MAKNLAIATMCVILMVVCPLTTANSPILDTDGNPLVAGSQYFILAPPSGFSPGGLTQSIMGPSICPLFVGQQNTWSQRGRPLIITPTNSTETEISSGMDVNIAFSGPSICRNTNTWQVNNSNGVFFISTDGTPGTDAHRSTFHITKTHTPGIYTILYCNTPWFVPGCAELEANMPEANGAPWSWLTLVPIRDPAFFFFRGFVFQKAVTLVAPTK